MKHLNRRAARKPVLHPGAKSSHTKTVCGHVTRVGGLCLYLIFNKLWSIFKSPPPNEQRQCDGIQAHHSYGALGSVIVRSDPKLMHPMPMSTLPLSGAKSAEAETMHTEAALRITPSHW